MRNCIQIDFFLNITVRCVCVQHSPLHFFLLSFIAQKRKEAKSITILVFMKLYNKPYDYYDFAMHKNESIDQIFFFVCMERKSQEKTLILHLVRFRLNFKIFRFINDNVNNGFFIFFLQKKKNRFSYYFWKKRIFRMKIVLH